ncbi:MAG: EthD domain-containing protein [Desulfuromonadales bacterium]|nr:EthD domain-containing protein [Desulfuromonadales bacterium]
MYRKVQLLLAARPGKSLDDLDARLAAEGERVRALLPGDARHLRAVRLADDPTAQTVHAAEMKGEPASFEAVFEVGSPGGDWAELTALFAGVVRNLADWIVAEKSAVIAGTEHVILPGECPLLLIFALRRLPALTSPQFHDYWLNRHAEVARTVPVLRAYRQFHADAKASAAAGRALGLGIVDFEGAAQGYYRDIGDFMAIMAQPAVVADALADEKRFIDHGRSVLGLYRVVGS